MSHAETDTSTQDEATHALCSGGLVSWPAQWSLMDGHIWARAHIPVKNPPQKLVVKIDINELKNRQFRAQLQALLAG